MQRKYQSGATLIEVMLSFVILGIGLLGTAGLVIHSMRNLTEQGTHATAMHYARDLTERMAGNRIISTITTATDNPYIFNTRTTEPSATIQDCATKMCTDKERANRDVTEWWSRLKSPGATGTGAIPGVAAVVCFDTPKDGGSVSMGWGCTKTDRSLLVIKIGWHTRDVHGNVDTSAEKAQVVYVVAPGSEL